MITTYEIKGLLEQLVGLPCRRTLFTEMGTLVLFIGDIVRVDPIRTVWRLHIDCTWRIAADGKLLAGSFDSPALANSTARLLNTLTISKVAFDFGLGDLCIELGEKYKLLICTYSLQDEHWELRKSDGFRMNFGPQAQWLIRNEKPDTIE